MELQTPPCELVKGISKGMTQQRTASPHLLVPMLFSSDENRVCTLLPGAETATTSLEVYRMILRVCSEEKAR